MPQVPTNPGDIDIVGQRRRPGGSFPSRSGGGGGNSAGNPSSPEQIQLNPADEDPPEGSVDPCADPATALEWNADAAAAEGLRRMQIDAGDPLLDSRERSIVVAHNPLTGETHLGNLGVGPPFAGIVDFDMTGIDPAHIVGLMHSHVGSGPYPSGPDRTEVFSYWANQIALAGGDPSRLRLYMAGTRADPGGPARLQIRVYDQTNLDGDEANPGDEVNPDAQFCPS